MTTGILKIVLVLQIAIHLSTKMKLFSSVNRSGLWFLRRAAHRCPDKPSGRDNVPHQHRDTTGGSPRWVDEADEANMGQWDIGNLVRTCKPGGPVHSGVDTEEVKGVMMPVPELEANMMSQTKDQTQPRQWGSSLPGLRRQDPPLGPPSTIAEIFKCTDLSPSNISPNSS